MKCAAIYGECRCRSIGFGGNIGRGCWKLVQKKARREIDMQSFDCRKNTTLNAGALANKSAGIAALPGLKETVRVLISESLKRVNSKQTIAAKLLGRSRCALSRRSCRCRKSPAEKWSGDCLFKHLLSAPYTYRFGTAILRRGATFFAFVNFCRTSPKTLVWQGFTRRQPQISFNCVNKCRIHCHRHSKLCRP